MASVIAMSNLAHFTDRLITDGKYKKILLIHDGVSIRDDVFLPRLGELGFGKYTVEVVNIDLVQNVGVDFYFGKPKELGILHIMMLCYRAGDRRHMLKPRYWKYFREDAQNLVLFVPQQPPDRMENFWTGLKLHPTTNISVIFYQMEQLVLENKMETYVLNYNASGAICPQKIIVENLTHTINVYDKIFGSIVRLPSLSLTLNVPVNASAIKATTFTHENSKLINFGSADYYLSNFIARNLRYKDIAVQQEMMYTYLPPRADDSRLKSERYISNASNESIYGELYNEPHEKYHTLLRSASTRALVESSESDNSITCVFNITEMALSGLRCTLEQHQCGLLFDCVRSMPMALMISYFSFIYVENSSKTRRKAASHLLGNGFC